MQKNGPKQTPRFDPREYKKRMNDAIQASGGVAKFAEIIEITYQVVQGWAKGSVPRRKDWIALERSGRGMAWYLFGVDEVPDKPIDRQALAAAIKGLRQKMDELEAICSDVDKKEKHRRSTDRPEPPKLKSVKN